MSRTPMTREGLEQLKKKLKYLEEEELPRIQKAIGDALAMGDISENSELDAAREEAWRTEKRMSELSLQISSAEIIDESKVPHDVIAFGARVEVYDYAFKEKLECLLLGQGEKRDGIEVVSVDSPLGQALLGHRAGEEVSFAGPRGPMKFKILSFRYGD